MYTADTSLTYLCFELKKKDSFAFMALGLDDTADNINFLFKDNVVTIRGVYMLQNLEHDIS